MSKLCLKQFVTIVGSTALITLGCLFITGTQMRQEQEKIFLDTHYFTTETTLNETIVGSTIKIERGFHYNVFLKWTESVISSDPNVPVQYFDRSKWMNGTFVTRTLITNCADSTCIKEQQEVNQVAIPIYFLCDMDMCPRQVFFQIKSYYFFNYHGSIASSYAIGAILLIAGLAFFAVMLFHLRKKILGKSEFVAKINKDSCRNKVFLI